VFSLVPPELPWHIWLAAGYIGGFAGGAICVLEYGWRMSAKEKKRRQWWNKEKEK